MNPKIQSEARSPSTVVRMLQLTETTYQSSLSILVWKVKMQIEINQTDR